VIQGSGVTPNRAARRHSGSGWRGRPPAAPRHTGPVLDGISFEAGPQVGGRRPAPGRLGLVQAFVNSFFELGDDWREPIPTRGRDAFATAGSTARWLRARGLLSSSARLTRAQHRRALDLREGIRALLYANNGERLDREAFARLARAARRPGVTVELVEPRRALLAPARRDVDSALSFIAGLVLESMADGTWQRLKACPGEHCGWGFYDHSRNQTGSWCSMALCGGRAKARAYRRRRRGSLHRSIARADPARH
jgi:predicted RNA-binding Zn ribbon-like protein